MEWDKRADLAVSDYSQLGALREFLGWAVPWVRVLHIPGRPGQGEQPILALLASRAGMLSAVRLLPDFLMSRRPALAITITVGGTSVELTATNVDEVLPVLGQALGTLPEAPPGAA
jgi:Effector Associated Constant Component 1